MPNLITDRTQADVIRANEINKKVYDAWASAAASAADANALMDPMEIAESTLTDAEFAEWLSGLKGAYNYTDMNRVGQAVQEIGTILKNLPDELNEYRKAKEVYYNEKFLVKEYDPGKVNVAPKFDWAMTDPVTPTAAAAYLKDIENLRSILPDGCPVAPFSLSQFTFQKANDIERILQTVHNSATAIQNRIIAAIDKAAPLGTDWEKWKYTTEVRYSPYAVQTPLENIFYGKTDETSITGWTGYTTQWVDIGDGKRECHYVPSGVQRTLYPTGGGSTHVNTFPDNYTVHSSALLLYSDGTVIRNTLESTVRTIHSTRTYYYPEYQVGTVHTDGFAYPDGLTNPIIKAYYGGEPSEIVGGGYYYIRRR